MIIGITGGSGCGKTTALRAVSDLGGLVLDCDEIYHQLLESSPSLLCAISNRFAGVVTHGKLDRKALGNVVFHDSEALLDLNHIAHGAVLEEVQKRLSHWGGPLAAIDAIALFEGGLSPLCQKTVAISAPLESRVSRLMAREGISRDYALARIGAQKPDSYFRSLCDDTLENQGTKEEFYQQALNLFQRYLQSPSSNESILL